MPPFGWENRPNTAYKRPDERVGCAPPTSGVSPSPSSRRRAKRETRKREGRNETWGGGGDRSTSMSLGVDVSCFLSVRTTTTTTTTTTTLSGGRASERFAWNRKGVSLGKACPGSLLPRCRMSISNCQSCQLCQLYQANCFGAGLGPVRAAARHCESVSLPIHTVRKRVCKEFEFTLEQERGRARVERWKRMTGRRKLTPPPRRFDEAADEPTCCR
ncbi:hypothetical protein LZ30DRAFT_149151 [Colletotrichum cereale]|nr:hypothetical protein LZ30DRAFT_149151 [Colletotrichum cereale]